MLGKQVSQKVSISVALTSWREVIWGESQITVSLSVFLHFYPNPQVV